jgi:hypothetical protein
MLPTFTHSNFDTYWSSVPAWLSDKRELILIGDKTRSQLLLASVYNFHRFHWRVPLLSKISPQLSLLLMSLYVFLLPVPFFIPYRFEKQRQHLSKIWPVQNARVDGQLFTQAKLSIYYSSNSRRDTLVPQTLENKAVYIPIGPKKVIRARSRSGTRGHRRAANIVPT